MAPRDSERAFETAKSKSTTAPILAIRIGPCEGGIYSHFSAICTSQLAEPVFKPVFLKSEDAEELPFLIVHHHHHTQNCAIIHWIATFN
jgi:hypothetical protein